jgi:hypothetical protein
MSGGFVLHWPTTWQGWVKGYLAVGYGIVLLILLIAFWNRRIRPSLEERLAMGQPTPLRQWLTDHNKRKALLKNFGGLNLLALGWPVVIGLAVDALLDHFRKPSNQHYWDPPDGDTEEDTSPKCECKLKDLVARVDWHEVARSHRVHDPLNRTPNVPFGHLNPAWERFKAKYSMADALWSFDIQPKWSGTYQYQTLRRGYAVVRHGKVVAEMFVEWS